MSDNEPDLNLDDIPRRRREDQGFPAWAKLAAVVIASTVTVITWVEVRFVSRVEYQSHISQQKLDMDHITTQQQEYAIAERGTATNLGQFDVRLTRIESKLDWIIDEKFRNGNGNGR